MIATTSAVIGENTLHTDNCNVVDCPICSLINISTVFIKNIVLININIMVLIVIVPLMQLF